MNFTLRKVSLLDVLGLDMKEVLKELKLYNLSLEQVNMILEGMSLICESD